MCWGLRGLKSLILRLQFYWSNGGHKYSAVIWNNFPLKIAILVCIFQARCLKAKVGTCTSKGKCLDFFQSDGNLTLVAVITGNIKLWSVSAKSEKVERFSVFICHQTYPIAADAREAQGPIE